jgi:hypothetical protein
MMMQQHPCGRRWRALRGQGKKTKKERKEKKKCKKKKTVSLISSLTLASVW